MREDVNTLEEALDRCGAMTWRGGESSAKLSATELADAAQAATDTRGWRSRLAALIEKHDRKKQQEEIRAGKSIDMSLVLPEFLLDEMVTLLRQMDELLARYLASAPVEKRNRLNAERGSDVVVRHRLLDQSLQSGLTYCAKYCTIQGRVLLSYYYIRVLCNHYHIMKHGPTGLKYNSQNSLFSRIKFLK